VGRLLSNFNLFDRNAFRQTLEESAEMAAYVIERIQTGAVVESDAKINTNILASLASFTGIIIKTDGVYQTTQVADVFMRLYRQNKSDAWRWLITRSLWRYVVPNGTRALINNHARNLNTSFNFFNLLLGLLSHLDTFAGNDRFLYYEEFCQLFSDDANWSLSAFELFQQLLGIRSHGMPEVTSRQGFLDRGQVLGLESQYEVGRDNLNGAFQKLLNHTGFFEYVYNGRIPVGIALSTNIDRVLRKRFRFILDNPVIWNSQQEDWGEFLNLHAIDLPREISLSVLEADLIETPAELEIEEQPLEGIVEAAKEDFDTANFLIDKSVLRRFVGSLLAKRFVILTGLSGSGKTKLAQAFAAWLSTPAAHQYEVISVGPDWTGNEFILGYADALDRSRYIRPQSLDVILRAVDNPQQPYFLILDEMNLSHVERYFSDLLSALESDEPVRLHGDHDENGNPIPRDGVPSSLTLPDNLFIIGTVNVDETTYMFSPKVLDRANVIEFRVSDIQIQAFINNPVPIQMDFIGGRGRNYASAFVAASREDVQLNQTDQQKMEAELLLIFRELSKYGAEFGFRNIKEIARFLYFYRRISQNEWLFEEAIDAQIAQKLLPKFNGSRRKLERVLCALGALSFFPHEWDDSHGRLILNNEADLIRASQEFASLDSNETHPLARQDRDTFKYPKEHANFRLSYEKIVRMLELLEQNGFTSFAEA
jgi:energy-coupling factor transporter ATP-binding protein EcfA2